MQHAVRHGYNARSPTPAGRGGGQARADDAEQ
jgi:hypothetical protein